MQEINNQDWNWYFKRGISFVSGAGLHLTMFLPVYA